MPWPDWSRETNIDILEAHRRFEVQRVRKYQTRALSLRVSRARELISTLPAREVRQEVRQVDFDRIMAETGIRARSLLALLVELGLEYRGGFGYPVSWPGWQKQYVARWIEEKIIPSIDYDDWLSLDEIGVSMMRDDEDKDVDITNRGLRMALESHGYKTIRRADSRGIIGYRIKPSPAISI